MIGVAFNGDEERIKSDQHVYQWDTGQKIMVSGLGNSAINKVHFTFKGLKTAYVVDTTNSSGTITVDIPDIVLRYGKDVYMYLCIKNSTGNVVTIKTVIIPVIKRNMPENYMYDDDELVATSLDELQAEIQRSTGVDTDHEARLVSLEEAKTNASGITYETLKARLDADVNALNDKINNDASKFNIENPIIKTIDDADLNGVATIVDGKIEYTHTGSGNNWWRIPFNPLDITSKTLKVDVKVDSLSGGINVFFFPMDVNGNGQYIRIGIIGKAGTYSFTADLEQLQTEKNLDYSKTAYIFFANMVSNVSAIYSEVYVADYLTRVTGRLGTLISDVYDIANENTGNIKKNADDIKNAINLNIENPIIKTIDDADLNGVATIVDGKIEYTHTGSGNNWWRIPFNLTDISSNFLEIKVIIDELSGAIMPYLYASDREGTYKYIGLGAYTSSGEYSKVIDINYHVVYNDIDVSKPAYILFANYGNEVSAAYSSALIIDHISEVEGTLGNVINQIYVKADSALTAANKQIVDYKIADNNGKKYVLSINDGSIVSIPVLPERVVYIGNSLLIGFGAFGMAASDSEHDYYHYVNTYITEQGITLTSTKVRGVEFENCTSESQQDSWLNGTLSPHLNADIELVIIQLGDNVNTEDKNTAFASGAEKLVKFIRNNAPNARIAWVGEWFSTAEKQQVISNACDKYGANFIDISTLPNISGNKANIGDVITYDDGTTETIESSGVASHPSSQGMKQIADKIIATLF